MTYRHTRMTYRHKDIQTYRHTDIRTYRHADMRTCRHTDIRTYGRTRQRTTPDVMMTMPMNTDDIDVVTSVDDDDEKDLSIQIQRHADMQIGTRPDIQACRGTQRNVEKKLYNHTLERQFWGSNGPRTAGRPL